jgi:uncharacterized protein (TIGR02594 family)
MKTKKYIVRAGDTLTKIAGYFDLPLSELLALNPKISDQNNIFPRQIIQVPDVEPDKPSIHALATKEAEPLWIKIALREMATGVAEFPDPEENPRIVEYLKSCGITGPVEGRTGDEIPWCSSFVNWCMREAGIRGTNDARAISWKEWGQTLDEDELRYGCIVVFPHHVGFYFGDYNEDKISLLGGNQSDEINISPYPKQDIVGRCWPS